MNRFLLYRLLKNSQNVIARYEGSTIHGNLSGHDGRSAVQHSKHFTIDTLIKMQM
jgi:hypothetical protein